MIPCSEVAKRSPILGYNHNVRYRGIVFHVQTEDSGVLSPHLFTHLFHEGVIVSTRKLVYDNGSAEDAIKSLMQAQHKAVLKDLRRGHFDDKIDEYLGSTPGLLPRGTDAHKVATITIKINGETREIIGAYTNDGKRAEQMRGGQPPAPSPGIPPAPPSDPVAPAAAPAAATQPL